MRILDNFLFYNELDLLELRLRLHYDYVDQFLITECDYTFTRNYKGFNLEKHKDRFAQWWDKITYIKVSDPPNAPAEQVEQWQRSFRYRDMMKFNLTSNDVVLISDVDELIRPEAFDYIKNTDYTYYSLYMPVFNFKFNYMNTNGHYRPNDFWLARAYRGFFIEGYNGMTGAGHLVPKDKRIGVHHAGWHFSFLGDNKSAIDKLTSFSHTEYSTPEIINNFDIDERIKNKKDHGNRSNLIWESVKLDNYFPNEIVNNQEKYKDLILTDGNKSVLDCYPYAILQEDHNPTSHI